jgi:hypothetical protein
MTIWGRTRNEVVVVYFKEVYRSDCMVRIRETVKILSEGSRFMDRGSNWRPPIHDR